MQKVFYNILLPVCLRKETGATVEKAVEFANRLECNLHILFTMAPSTAIENVLRFKSMNRVMTEKKRQLNSLRIKYMSSMRPGSLLITAFQSGHIVEETTRYALDHNIDMIYFDETMSSAISPGMDINRFARAVQCSVLLDQSEPLPRSIEKIVLPIDRHLSVNRIRVAIFMAQQLHATIHLVSAEQEGSKEKNLRYLKKAYQLLKDNTSIELVCSAFDGDAGNHSALDYAASIQAGLIVSNPNTAPVQHHLLQRILPGHWFHKRRIPVMLVE